MPPPHSPIGTAPATGCASCCCPAPSPWPAFPARLSETRIPNRSGTEGAVSRRKLTSASRGSRQVTALQLGKIFVGLAAVAAAALFQKADLTAMMRQGETFDIHFAEAHRL